MAHLYGLQSKKASLDRYYKNFESEFPDKEEAVSVMAAVLGELGQILPWPTRQRWRKKTDFYSLFVVLARHVDQMPFDRDKREAMRVRLDTLSSEVDDFLRSDEPEIADISESAKDYARSVRASSDLGSRKNRDQALETVLFDSHYGAPVDVSDAAPDEESEE